MNISGQVIGIALLLLMSAGLVGCNTTNENTWRPDRDPATSSPGKFGNAKQSGQSASLGTATRPDTAGNVLAPNAKYNPLQVSSLDINMASEYVTIESRMAQVEFATGLEATATGSAPTVSMPSHVLIILQMWASRSAIPDPAALLLCVLEVAALLLSLMLPLGDGRLPANCKKPECQAAGRRAVPAAGGQSRFHRPGKQPRAFHGT